MEIGSSGKKSVTGAETSATDFKVKLSIDPGSIGLKPDMTADAEITTATHTNALTLPIQSIVVRDKKTVEKWTTKRNEEAKKSAKGKTEKQEKKTGTLAKTDTTVKTQTIAKSDSLEAQGRGKPGSEEVTGVFVVKGQIVRFEPVVTGIMSETDVELLKGISQNESVVTGPFRVLRDLKDGQKVKEEKKPAEGEKAKGKKGSKENE